jgi:hypothetical protein
LDVPSIHSVGTREKPPYKLPDKGRHRGLIPVKRSISKVFKSSKGRTVKTGALPQLESLSLDEEGVFYDFVANEGEGGDDSTL